MQLPKAAAVAAAIAVVHAGSDYITFENAWEAQIPIGYDARSNPSVVFPNAVQESLIFNGGSQRGLIQQLNAPQASKEIQLYIPESTWGVSNTRNALVSGSTSTGTFHNLDALPSFLELDPPVVSPSQEIQGAVGPYADFLRDITVIAYKELDNSALNINARLEGGDVGAGQIPMGGVPFKFYVAPTWTAIVNLSKDGGATELSVIRNLLAPGSKGCKTASATHTTALTDTATMPIPLELEVIMTNAQGGVGCYVAGMDIVFFAAEYGVFIHTSRPNAGPYQMGVFSRVHAIPGHTVIEMVFSYFYMADGHYWLRNTVSRSLVPDAPEEETTTTVRTELDIRVGPVDQCTDACKPRRWTRWYMNPEALSLVNIFYHSDFECLSVEKFALHPASLLAPL